MDDAIKNMKIIDVFFPEQEEREMGEGGVDVLSSSFRNQWRQ